MARDANTTLSHLYGLSGLVPGIVGLIYLVKTDAPWQEYALLLSGWVVAVAYGVMLWRCFDQARDDSLSIGTLTERVRMLEKELEHCIRSHSAELDRRHATMDYLAAQLTQKALPRSANYHRSAVQAFEGEQK